MFQNVSVPAVLPFESLPNRGWSIGELSQVTEERAIQYLKHLGGFTKNYQTGVRLCQCGHIYDIEGEVICMFMQSVGLQCTSNLLLQVIHDYRSLKVCSWKDHNIRLKVLIAIVQQVKPRNLFM